MIDLKISLKDKLTLLIAAIILLCIAGFSFNSYQRTKATLIESLRAELKDVASYMTLFTTSEEIDKALSGTETSEAYWNLKKKLNRLEVMGGGKISEVYILVMTRKKDIWEFVADNQLYDKDKMSVLHEEYDVSGFPELKLAFGGPTADKTMTEDKWGRWLSGYAPIYDQEARPVAILGVDMKATDIEKLERDILDSVLIYLLIGSIAALALGRISAQTIIGPIAAIAKGVREIKDRKYGTQINIKRNDELGDLINTFNDMSLKLSEVDKIKADFLSVISHELYTPITPIRGGAATLKLTANLSDDLKAIVDMIERQAAKLQGLVDEVLDFSWLEIKDLKLNKEPIALNSLADEIIGQMQSGTDKDGLPLFGSKNIELKTEYDQTLPTVSADKKRILHIIKILLDNAIKFSPDKGKVIIKTAATPKGINLEIKDFGVGIDQANMINLFEKFYQTEDHLTRTHGGLGLGLAIAKKIVEAHGGTVKAESPGLGQGSTFGFTLPIA
ncbi:MAG: HAMP domain-containing sensor histidine kinase [Candidatus Margulisbacteria bacterium]|nr:HAMP domain-containing sensor histidine kinase [Candidatus Margulisiibacteriota bacterium]